VEVKIGIQHAPRELVLESEQSPAEVEAAVTEALNGKSGLLQLVDEKGRRVLVPADKLAYIEIGEESSRRDWSEWSDVAAIPGRRLGPPDRAGQGPVTARVSALRIGPEGARWDQTLRSWAVTQALPPLGGSPCTGSGCSSSA
jgi:Protein of unknown function (DUF3107)